MLGLVAFAIEQLSNHKVDLAGLVPEAILKTGDDCSAHEAKEQLCARLLRDAGENTHCHAQVIMGKLAERIRSSGQM
jgi:hypothetical protein